MTDISHEIRSEMSAVIPAGGDTATPVNLAKRLRFLARHGVSPGRRVLDAGCGRGEYVLALRQRGVEAFGLEYLADKVAAHVRGVPPGCILRADLDNLPYADGAFDTVFLNEVLEHVPHERRALREVRRVLRPGGTLIVLSPNRLYPFESHGVHLARSGRLVPPFVPFIPYLPMAIGQKVFRYWARNYWPSELAGLIRSAGFRVVRTDFIWQTFENISGHQPYAISLLRPFLRSMASVGERLPIIRRLGVSQAIVAARQLVPLSTAPDRAAREIM
jgi:SAM-dependent methyltransferase